MANKYKAIPTFVGDIRFASRAEANRYSELLLLFRGGVIRNLELQPEFPVMVNGKKVFTYRADFAYFEGQQRVIEDVKGFRTPVYKLKKKIIEAQYNVTIKEIRA